ncbi:MAG: hypothetical protein J6X44_09820 [Thermoguttaceae bacterium]|nr:hypothetical protein [Thermoguttaceae bacterium]
MSVSLVNDTISANSAAIGGGLALDNASTEIKNTIVAKNQASDSGADVAIERTATVVLYASLIGDGEDSVNPDAMSVAEGFSALVGTTANPVDPKFGEHYALTAVSPAVNTGVNSFIEGVDKDVYGSDRIVADHVDMGAVEYSAVAPDLTFGPGALVGWYSTADGVDTGKFVEGWDVCFDYMFGNYGSGVVLNSFDYTITVDRLDSEGNVVEGASKVFTRTYGDNVAGYMSKEFWLQSGQTFEGYWNIGQFDAGRYQATISLDVNGAVFESNDDNNSYALSFEVSERPSLVVTTELDVVDQYDGLTSLREAIAAVGESSGRSISIDKALENGATFALAANEEIGVPEGAIATYVDGEMTFVRKGYETEEGEVVEDEIVALDPNVEYALVNGETMVWNGADVVTLTSTIADTISFASNVHGKTISLVDGEFTIDRDMTIAGPEEGTVTIDAHEESRIFFVAHGDVRVGGLTLVNAKADEGAAIYNAGDLSVSNVAIQNASANSGAGVYNAETATVDLWNVSFVDMNAAENGGAIYNAGDLVGNLVSFEGAKAVDGAAIYNVGDVTINQSSFQGGEASNQAGAIYNAAGTLAVANASFDSNTAKYGGAIVNYQGQATVETTGFTNNVATGDAGAIDNYGDLTLTDVVFNGNKANGFGGALYNSLSSTSDPYVVTLNGVVEFLANVASKGGAVYNAANSSIVGDEGSVKFGGNVGADGAAIYNSGTIKAGSSWSFEGNSATGSGAALYNASGSATFASVAFASNMAANGAAVYNAATFNATNANFKSNVATGSGAALYNAKGASKISNSVLWLNEAGANGGAIYVEAGSIETRNATIAANSAAEKAGGVYNAGTFNAYNTIVADNYAAEAVDLYATTTKSNFRYSLLGSTAGVNKNPSMTGSKTGDPGFAVAPVFAGGRVTNAVDLRLTVDSQAVNAGYNSYALDATGKALVYDLEGNDRVCTTLDAVDMGAFEFPFEEPSATVTTNLDVDDPTDGVVSLREAIEYATRLGEETVTFDPSVTNVILNETLYVDSAVTIGNDDQRVTLESSGFEGAMVVVGAENDKANVKFVNVDIVGGTNGVGSDNPDNAGGGVRNYATLTLDKVGVRDNAAAYGGGVYNAGTMTIVDSEIVGNSAGYYGGVYNRGSLAINRTTIADNSAEYYGGGVGTYTGATIANSLIVGNKASLGAGVYAQVNMADLFASDASFDVNLINSTIVGNTATGAKSESHGAGVWANHVLNVKNSILYGNSANSAADLYATTIMASSKTTLAYSDIGSANISIS